MALCIDLSLVFTAGATWEGYSTYSATIRAGSSSGGALAVTKAVYADGAYTCPTHVSDYLLLSPAETNALSQSSPFVATPEHYTAVASVFGAALVALAVIWGAKQVLRIFQTHTES